jgi:hypothetical protein
MLNLQVPLQESLYTEIERKYVAVRIWLAAQVVPHYNWYK